MRRCPSRRTASYDGDGLRVSKWDYLTGQHDYSWGPGGVLFDSNQSTTHTPGLSQRRNGVDLYAHRDVQGSLRFQANYTGWETDLYRYDAFGNRVYRIGEAYPTEFQYGGGFGYETEPVEAWPGDRIGLELTYVQQRWYDPAVGRWLTPDPIGLAGGLNLWSYCDGDPVNQVDPDGLYGVWIGSWRLGDDRPWLVFDREGLVEGLETGLHGTASGASFGLYDGGEYACKPGFGVSRALGGFGSSMLVQAGTMGAAPAASGLLSRLPKPMMRPGFLRLGGAAAAEGGAVRGLLPSLQVGGRQFGRKIGKHAVEWGLDPRNPSHRRAMEVIIQRIWRGAREFRQGPWNPTAGGLPDAIFAIRGRDVLVVKPSGEFITILKNGINNGWVQGAVRIH